MGSESESGAEKSEEPTGKRISQARGDGQVGKSTDLAQVVGITSAFLALQFLAPYMWEDLQLITKGSLSFDVASEPLNVEVMRRNFWNLMMIILPDVLALMIISAFFGAGCLALQTKFLWSNKLLKPKFSQLNPIQGIKRIFGVQNTMNLLKSIAKLAIICPIAYIAFFDLFPELVRLMELPINQQLPYTSYAASYIFWRIIILLLVLAIIDLIWQKWHTYKGMKMTKQEVKDEQKSVEGDEATKRSIRQKGLQKARERMMTSVPTADVVVTNPTHLAIALSYEMKKGSAPKVVAKGRGHIAKHIRKIARENGVPVIERKPLARALYKAAEVGQTIPYELFAAVAELFAYIYKMKGRNRSQQTTQNGS